MKSPFTDGETQLKKEQKNFVFRKESFTVLYHYYVCNDTKEQFTTTELDTLNISQVHNKYREKYGIPFTDEIINIRKKYDLNASKMSEVLGLGTNGYRNYEAGEIPSVATGRLIRLAEKPDEFIK
ncbi:MAG: type II toxin-antitoxin system MqsA family antitoxin, partial [Ferruginibacter sp.]